MKNIDIHIPNNLSTPLYNRIRYVIDFTNGHPFFKNVAILNCEVGKSERFDFRLKIDNSEYAMPCGNYFLHFSAPDFLALKANVFWHEEEIIYAVEKDERAKSKLVENGAIAIDLLEIIYFHISRVEETVLNQEKYIGDKKSFEEKLFLIREKIYRRPVVDDLVRVLLKVLTGREVKHKTEVVLSHDIDEINKFHSPLTVVKKIGGQIKNRQSLKGFKPLFRSYKDYLIQGNDPYDTFDWMLKKGTTEKFIYFLSGGNHYWDRPYNMKSDYFRKIIQLVEKRKYQVGIHPSYESWNKIDLIRKEKSYLEEVIGSEIKLSRQHFLNFDISVTPDLLVEVGINRDSSLGYTRHVGFRCGTGFPYKLYDFNKEEKSILIEDPLVLMDSSAFHEVNYEDEKLLPLLTTFLETNREGTRVLCNFHNTFFDEMEMRRVGLKSFYHNHFSV